MNTHRDATPDVLAFEKPGATPLPASTTTATAAAAATAAAPSGPVPMIDLTEQYAAIKPEIDAVVAELFATQRFVLGDAVREFEEQVAEYCDARHAVGCASGTDALILAMMALDIGPGDEVITTPFTFFATASSIVRCGATPVFVDIDPVSFNLDIEQVERAITPRTKAIMPVHLFGQCAEMEPVWRMAVENGLHIIEDAAQAIGATYRGRATGVLGTVGCFSFFPTKNLGGAGDGGMMTTDDDAIAERLRRLRVHGDVGRYRHVEVGVNSRLDALQAVVLAVKLRHLDAWHRARRENADRYERLFAACGLDADVTRPAARIDGEHVYNQYVVRIAGGRRDEVKARLAADQVGCAVYYPQSLHEQECFRGLGYARGDFPVAERACDEVLALPIYPELGAERQTAVVSSLARACGRTLETTSASRRAA